MFKLGLWSALVFFDHGSEMQLATALVVNVLQLCVHVYVLPMGGASAALLNFMQSCTLVLTTYINFGALTMNYLELSKTLARFLDPTSVDDEYDAPISSISIIMQVLTIGLFLCFGGVAVTKGVEKARRLDLDALRDKFGSLRANKKKPAAAGLQLSVRPHSSPPIATTPNPMNPTSFL